MLLLAALLSGSVHLSAVTAPPAIKASTALNTQSVFRDQPATFTVTATGDLPLQYQWRRDGLDLPGQTNRTLKLLSAQPTDEGSYDVVVANTSGSVTSYGARLYVVPPTSELIRSQHTNAAGLRLPYLYHLPAGYDSVRRYPLIVQFHGSGGIDETTVGSFFPAQFFVHTSYVRQAAESAVVVYPTRRAGNDAWSSQYVAQVADMLDDLIVRLSIDQDRIYVVGTSEGVHAAWDLMGLRPGLFAAATAAAGWKGNTAADAIKDVPLWVWHAADDPMVNVSQSRALVQALRQAGGRPIYTEFQLGGHPGGMGPGLMSAQIYDWLRAHRRGASAPERPRLAIAAHTGSDPMTTSSPVLSLEGAAEALESSVSRVYWENVTAHAKGDAQGANPWKAAIPLQPGSTNVIVVTATTPSGFPVNGGETTFNETISVVSSPVVVSLSLQGPALVLSWTGGDGPFTVQRAIDLGRADWEDFRVGVTSPVLVEPEGKPQFYRVLAR